MSVGFVLPFTTTRATTSRIHRSVTAKTHHCQNSSINCCSWLSSHGVLLDRVKGISRILPSVLQGKLQRSLRCHSQTDGQPQSRQSKLGAQDIKSQSSMILRPCRDHFCSRYGDTRQYTSCASYHYAQLVNTSEALLICPPPKTFPAIT